MLYIKLFIEREKNIGQSVPECPFKTSSYSQMVVIYQFFLQLVCEYVNNIKGIKTV